MILMVAGEFLDYLKLPAKTVGSVAMATVASVDTPTSRIILGWAKDIPGGVEYKGGWIPINFRGQFAFFVEDGDRFFAISPFLLNQ
jgi:hypothetical protein